MWPFKKRKSDADIAVQAMPRAIDIAAQKWIEFEAQAWAKEMELEQKLFLFSEGIRKGFKQWDEFKNGPDEFFFLIAIKGIERSKTHLRMELEAVLSFPIPGPHERSDEEEMAELKRKLIDRAARKWLYFEGALIFQKDVPFSTRIQSFRAPFLQGVRRDFPMFRDASDDEFDGIIALGIDQTGTHSIVEVQRALSHKV